MAWETWVQSQVESYQRRKKRYLIPPCLTFSIIRYGSRVKCVNPGKAIEKGAFRSPSTTVANFTIYIYIIYISVLRHTDMHTHTHQHTHRRIHTRNTYALAGTGIDTPANIYTPPYNTQTDTQKIYGPSRI